MLKRDTVGQVISRVIGERMSFDRAAPIGILKMRVRLMEATNRQQPEGQHYRSKYQNSQRSAWRTRSARETRCRIHDDPSIVRKATKSKRAPTRRVTEDSI